MQSALAPHWHQAEVKLSEAGTGLQLKIGVCDVSLSAVEEDRLRDWLNQRSTPGQMPSPVLRLRATKAHNNF